MTGWLGAGAVRGLRRFAASRSVVSACDLCGEPIPERHQHLYEAEERRLICACRACGLRFPVEGGAGNFRLLETRLLPLDVRLTPADLAGLEIPVTLAFLAPSRAHDTLFLVYPNAAGAAETRLPLGTWTRLTAAHPALAQVGLDAEGVLVDSGSAPARVTLLSLDAWQAVVGTLKTGPGTGALRARVAEALRELEEDRR